jgi:hypothetical protein
MLVVMEPRRLQRLTLVVVVVVQVRPVSLQV